MLPDPSDPLGPAFRAGIDAALTQFLDGQTELVTRIGAGPVWDLARSFTAGGKRLRPAFCYWSYVAAAGQPADPAALLQASASLDLLHASALVHDDLIDASDTRRGQPSSHRQFEAQHRAADGQGDAEDYGRAAAILLGDLLLVWSTEMFDHAAFDADARDRARRILETMRTEVTCGQFLDVSAASRVVGADTPAAELAVARKILEYKSASYSIRRPAQAGAALAGDDERLLQALGNFGSPLGAAFQLRDDVLGVFGDPDTTGKPLGDDIREGKRTVLVLTALERGDARQSQILSALLGHEDLTPAQLEQACEIIDDTGARAAVEELIELRTEEAMAALGTADMTGEGRAALVELAELSVRRDH